MSNILSKSKLQRALDSLASATNKAHHFRAIIANHCEEKYGCDPADIDNDEFID